MKTKYLFTEDNATTPKPLPTVADLRFPSMKMPSHTAAQRRAIGRQVAQCFGEPLMSIKEIADALGVSKSYVRKLEEQALYKVAMAVRRRCIEQGIEPPEL